MFKEIFAIVCELATRFWWPFWSNRRWRKAVKEDIEIEEEDRVWDYESLKKVANQIYKKFRYTHDGVDQLFDSIVPPPQNYINYRHDLVYDDCDGFHSTLYHCLHRSNIECYLLTANAIGAGHCILLYKLNAKWGVVDYTSVKPMEDTPEVAIKEYNKTFPSRYGAKSEVLYNGLVEFDYKEKKFRYKEIEELDDTNLD